LVALLIAALLHCILGGFLFLLFWLVFADMFLGVWGSLTRISARLLAWTAFWRPIPVNNEPTLLLSPNFLYLFQLVEIISRSQKKKKNQLHFIFCRVMCFRLDFRLVGFNDINNLKIIFKKN